MSSGLLSFPNSFCALGCISQDTTLFVWRRCGWSKCDGPLGVAQVRRKHGGIQAGRLGGRAPEPHGCALGPRPPGKPSAIAHPGGSAGDEKPYPGAERPTREFESP